MVSIAMASVASCCAVQSLVAAIAGDQVHDETGGRAAQRDSSRYGQKRDAETAVGASAKYESDATGDCQRGQRLLSDVLADVAIPSTPFLARFLCGQPC
jgi:hypothetical protein